MIMPWGKHKDVDMEDIPSSYLSWLAENCDNDDICQAADNEYTFRTDHNTHFED